MTVAVLPAWYRVVVKSKFMDYEELNVLCLKNGDDIDPTFPGCSFTILLGCVCADFRLAHPIKTGSSVLVTKTRLPEFYGTDMGLEWIRCGCIKTRCQQKWVSMHPDESTYRHHQQLAISLEDSGGTVLLRPSTSSGAS